MIYIFPNRTMDFSMNKSYLNINCSYKLQHYSTKKNCDVTTAIIKNPKQKFWLNTEKQLKESNWNQREFFLFPPVTPDTVWH